MALSTDFRRLKRGSYINDLTKEVISQRQYYKLKRGGLNNEQLAKLNVAIDEATQLARPARGRSSVLKIVPEIRADIIAARKEQKERKKADTILKRELLKSEKALEKHRNKKIKKRNITNQMLRPGRQGVRVAFEDYSDYVRMFEQGKKNGNIFAYGLGWHGVDIRPGIPASKIGKDITVFNLRTFDRPLSEDKFNNAFSGSVDAYSYMEFVSYWIHLAFSVEYAAKLAEKHNIKRRKK